jgi:hypothetical protein
MADRVSGLPSWLSCSRGAGRGAGDPEEFPLRLVFVITTFGDPEGQAT